MKQFERLLAPLEGLMKDARVTSVMLPYTGALLRPGEDPEDDDSYDLRRRKPRSPGPAGPNSGSSPIEELYGSQ